MLYRSHSGIDTYGSKASLFLPWEWFWGVPGIMDNYEYMDSLVNYLQHIHNVERVDFLPFHRLGLSLIHIFTTSFCNSTSINSSCGHGDSKQITPFPSIPRLKMCIRDRSSSWTFKET